MRITGVALSSLFAAATVAVLLAPLAYAQGSTGSSSNRASYVLEADGTWGAAQDAAVAAAGGTVLFRHGPSGIATVESEDPNFERKVKKSGAIAHATLDEVVQWQEPPTTEEIELTEEATPADETFINSQWNIVAIEAQGAWDAGYTGAGARVAVLDGGIHSTHLDLDGNLDIARSTSFVPGFAFNQDVGTFWHGTHVAGIVAAEDNALGTIGVAPGATIIGVKVLHNGSGSFGQVIAGILYASDPISEGGGGADIINMSLGAMFNRGGGNTGAGQLVAAMNRAVNYATGRNVLVVCSAGNDNQDMDHTGNLIHVPSMSGSSIGIAATGPVGYGVGWPAGATNFRRPASYTNHGNSQIWVAAPGGDFVLPGSAVCSIPRCCGGPAVTFPCWVHDMVASTSRGAPASNTSYSWSAGTSMAAPVVSGIAALVRQRFPGISVGDLKNHIAQTADDEGDSGHDPFYGRGFVNARRAATEGGPVAQLGQRPAVEDGRPNASGLWLAARPNPAAGSTEFRFSMPVEGDAALVIHDVAGRTIRTLARGTRVAGEHQVGWDLRDEAGQMVRGGLYFASLKTSAGVVTRSVVAIQ